jgi:hypothetical protein
MAFTLIKVYAIIIQEVINMNTKEKIYKNYIGLKVTDLQYDLLLRTFCKGKRDQLSVNLRNWIFRQIKEMPVITEEPVIEEPAIEYSLITKEGEQRTGVLLYENGNELDMGFFENKSDALKQIPAGAILREEGKS